MSGAYVIGVLAAIAAGMAYNLGMVIQKVAVRRIAARARFMQQLIRNRLWLGGFALQFLVGTPLNLYALAVVGPALLPGLMSSGLVVMAIAAVRLAGESLDAASTAGIGLVILAVGLLGFSGLAVDMTAINLFATDFLMRLTAFTAFFAALSLACHLLQSRIEALRGVLRMVDAGLLLAQANLWVGVLLGFVALWSAGHFAPSHVLPLALATAVCAACSVLGTVETQRAFQVGDAAQLVPIQSVPQQILPLLSYFVVFRLVPPSSATVPLAAAAAALILAGSGLLARHQAAASQGLGSA